MPQLIFHQINSIKLLFLVVFFQERLISWIGLVQCCLVLLRSCLNMYVEAAKDKKNSRTEEADP